MGNWTIWLSLEQEEKIKRLVEKRKFRSVYAVIQHAVERFLDGYKVEN